MLKKYVLFDFDGVIANTEESNARYLEKALRVYGVALTAEERKSLLGTNDASRLQRILDAKNIGISMEEFILTRRQMGNTYENGDICPMEGLIPMIMWLREKGIQTGIASSTSARLIITALNRMRITPLFDVIVCGDMCMRSKPHPEIYQKTMKHLEALPGECIVIEDSAPGIHAAKAAGAYVIAYCGSKIEQDICEADFSVDTYEECWKKLREMLDASLDQKYVGKTGKC
ncbi:MAG: HAD family phosphatase [Eubacteriales bacterium]|nr:HAD family phosphatase [Eubacteriales bacterium]